MKTICEIFYPYTRKFLRNFDTFKDINFPYKRKEKIRLNKKLIKSSYDFEFQNCTIFVLLLILTSNNKVYTLSQYYSKKRINCWQMKTTPVSNI